MQTSPKPQIVPEEEEEDQEEGRDRRDLHHQIGNHSIKGHLQVLSGISYVTTSVIKVAASGTIWGLYHMVPEEEGRDWRGLQRERRETRGRVNRV